MPPLVPVASRAKVPVAVIVPEVVNAVALAAESVKLILEPVDIPLPVVAVVSTKVTLPVVLAVQLGVAIFNEPIAPLPLVKAAEVVPVTVPAPGNSSRAISCNCVHCTRNIAPYYYAAISASS